MRIFLAHASEDKNAVRKLHSRLIDEDFQPWLDEIDIQPGQNWRVEITNAIRSSDIVLACLSRESIQKQGYVQQEFRLALYTYAQKPPGSIYLIPLKLDDCAVPDLQLPELGVSLRDIQWLDFWRPEGFDRLVKAIRRNGPKDEVDGTKSVDRIEKGAERLWNVPAPNPDFTGRTELFERLHTILKQTSEVALTGMGGIGKTQVAVEFAHRYRSTYQAVLWAHAESQEALITSFVDLAKVLGLPEKDAKEQGRTVVAVQHWLTHHSGWLLILDGAEEITLVQEFIPTDHQGHLLFTTRAPAFAGCRQRVPVDVMTLDEGARFLLRRIDKEPPLEKATEQARALTGELGGLPLALDQAGAFIVETPSTLEEYLAQYQKIGENLRAARGGGERKQNHESVSKTFALAFDKLSAINAVAANLLSLCAFLDPDNIPEEFLSEGVSELGGSLAKALRPPLALFNAIKDAYRFALLQRHPDTKTLTIHRVVQAVLRDGMKDSAQQQWAKLAVRAVNRCFPNVEFTAWPRCERLLTHAKACATLITRWGFTFDESLRLLNETGLYLYERGRFAEAEPLLRRALAMREEVLGAWHPDVTQNLNNLAGLYCVQARYAEAEPLFQRALRIRTTALGNDHPDVAQSLNNLALLYHEQARYAEAEPLFQRALRIRTTALGNDHPDVAQSLNNLALLYRDQSHYDEALSLLQRALTIREQVLGTNHPYVATSLNNLAALYQMKDRQTEAESLIRRALAIREETLGSDHPDVAASLDSLAALYQMQGRQTEAEDLTRRALAIREKM